MQVFVRMDDGESYRTGFRSRRDCDKGACCSCCRSTFFFAEAIEVAIMRFGNVDVILLTDLVFLE